MQPSVASWISRTSHEFVVASIQAMLQQVRSAIRMGHFAPDGPIDVADLALQLDGQLRQRLQPALMTVINATGSSCTRIWTSSAFGGRPKELIGSLGPVH